MASFTRLLPLLALDGLAAHQQVQLLAGDTVAQTLFGLLPGQMGQQVVDGEQRLPRPGADGHLHGTAVGLDDDAVKLQRDGHPLILADTPIVVGLEVGQLD